MEFAYRAKAKNSLCQTASGDAMLNRTRWKRARAASNVIDQLYFLLLTSYFLLLTSYFLYPQKIRSHWRISGQNVPSHPGSWIKSARNLLLPMRAPWFGNPGKWYNIFLHLREANV